MQMSDSGLLKLWQLCQMRSTSSYTSPARKVCLLCRTTLHFADSLVQKAVQDQLGVEPCKCKHDVAFECNMQNLFDFSLVLAWYTLIGAFVCKTYLGAI